MCENAFKSLLLQNYKIGIFEEFLTNFQIYNLVTLSDLIKNIAILVLLAFFKEFLTNFQNW